MPRSAANSATSKNSARSTSKRKQAPAEVVITEAIGYIRVSTEEQAEDGLSMQTQRERIRAQAMVSGWNLLHIYEDAGLSAKTLERPGLQAALGQLRPGRMLVVFKLDRLTRSVRDIYELIEQIAETGGEWSSVMEKIDTSTAMGRLLLGIMVQMSQWERETISERTVTVLAGKKRRGERLGTTPLGYRTIEDAEGKKTLQVFEEEMATVQLARKLRDGGLSLRKIAALLDEAGKKTKRGGNWEAATVARILKPRYAEEVIDRVNETEN